VLEEADIYCPYCGEPLTLLIDSTAGVQQYTEDCQVCCCPMIVLVQSWPDEPLSVEARREDDS